MEQNCRHCGCKIEFGVGSPKTKIYCSVRCGKLASQKRRLAKIRNKRIELGMRVYQKGENKIQTDKAVRFCKVCGKILPSNKSKYCSMECLKKRRRKLNLQKRTCIICGNEFQQKRESQKICGEYECRLGLEKLKRKDNPKKTKVIKCSICGKEFIQLVGSCGGKSTNKRYCSKQCKQKSEAIRRKKYKEKIGIDEFRARNRNHNNKRRNDPVRKMICNIRSRVGMSLKRNNQTKKNKLFSLLGYDINELKHHLENQFKDGMTWDNYGTEWHLDHRIPIDAFNFNCENTKQLHNVIKKCWSLNNLQPLDAIENMRKSNKIFY